jgi:nucleotidyltransferase substrate binding protein (TIGR01987 family)
MPELSVASLERALANLESGLARHLSTPEDDLLRDGLMQRFAFTYEHAHKLLRRYLELTSADPAGVDQMSFPELIRTGSEQGLLLSDWSRWRTFREMRARTSDTYHEETAREVVALIPEFVAEARFLRDELARRMA